MMMTPPSTDLSPFLAQRCALMRKAEEHHRQGVIAGLLTLGAGVSWLFCALFSVPAWSGGLLTALGGLILVCQGLAERWAKGRLKDIAEVEAGAASGALAMPAATALWMVARRRVWKGLARAAYWLAGELVASFLMSWLVYVVKNTPGLEHGVFGWTLEPLIVVPGVLGSLLWPFTLLLVMIRAVEFILVSRGPRRESQAAAADGAGSSPSGARPPLEP